MTYNVSATGAPNEIIGNLRAEADRQRDESAGLTDDTHAVVVDLDTVIDDLIATTGLDAADQLQVAVSGQELIVGGADQPTSLPHVTVSVSATQVTHPNSDGTTAAQVDPATVSAADAPPAAADTDNAGASTGQSSG